MNNIIHEYYKRDQGGEIIFVQLDPKSLKGVELIVYPNGKVQKTKRFFDKEIYEDLKHDSFEKANALEFNLYLKGLVAKK